MPNWLSKYPMLYLAPCFSHISNSELLILRQRCLCSKVSHIGLAWYLFRLSALLNGGNRKDADLFYKKKALN